MKGTAMPPTSPTPQGRLYGLMQGMLADAVGPQALASAPPRGIVTEEDVRRAAAALAGFIDDLPRQGIQPAQVEMMGALLLVIREYIKPLPVGESQGPGGQTTDGVTRDLVEIVNSIRTAGQLSQGSPVEL